MKRIINLSLFLAIAIFTLTGCGKETININDYVTISFEGYDTVGESRIIFDFDKMIDEHPNAFNIDIESSVDRTYITNQTTSKIINHMHLDETEDLRNGDIINLTLSKDSSDVKEFCEKYSVKIEFTDIQTTVEGLTPVEAINPFDYMDVSFEGLEEHAKINTEPIENDKNIAVKLDFGESRDLKNGDEITATIDSLYINGYYIYPEDYIYKGFYLSETEKTYTVDNLDRYAEKASEITQEALDAVYKTYHDGLMDYFDYEGNVDSVDIGAVYVLTDSSSSLYSNYVYVLFKITVDNNVFYWGGEAKDVLIHADGSCSELELKQTAKVNDNYWVGLNGIQKLESLERFEKKNINPYNNKKVDKIIF